MKSKEYHTDIKLLTIKQAAKLVEGLTEYRIRRLCVTGKLPCIMAGQKYLINEQTLLDYVTHPQAEQEDPTHE